MDVHRQHGQFGLEAIGDPAGGQLHDAAQLLRREARGFKEGFWASVKKAEEHEEVTWSSVFMGFSRLFSCFS